MIEYRCSHCGAKVLNFEDMYMCEKKACFYGTKHEYAFGNTLPKWVNEVEVADDEQK